jgi:hypothetical protein
MVHILDVLTTGTWFVSAEFLGCKRPERGSCGHTFLSAPPWFGGCRARDSLELFSTRPGWKHL